jgi:hypothetical protein
MKVEGKLGVQLAPSILDADFARLGDQVTAQPELRFLNSVHGRLGRTTSEVLALLCRVENYRFRT